MALTSSQLRGNSRLEQAASDRSKPLAVPEQGEAIRRLQRALLDLGSKLPRSTAKGGPDGIFGTETANAVKDFQRRNGLKADGMAGPQTLKLMDEGLARDEIGANHAVCDIPALATRSQRLALNFSLAGAPVTGPGPTPPPLPKDIALASVPEARQWVIAARDFIFDTRSGVRFPDFLKTVPRIAPRSDVTDLHFHFRAKPAAQQEAFLTGIFVNYSAILDLLGDAATHFDNDLRTRTPPDPLLRAWAHAPIGGFFDAKQAPKVFFRDMYANVTGPKCKVAMIVHECAHSAARARHFADDGPTKDGTPDKPDGLTTHPRNYKDLFPDEAAANACTYAAFAANCRFGSDIRPGAHDLTV